MEKSKGTNLDEFGEFGLIHHLTKDIEIKHSSTIKGVGDDAAVLHYAGKETIVTTDMLTEGIHFNLMYTPLKHLGYKSVVVNLSDIYAMNAIPRQIIVSLAISKKFKLDHIEELYAGIYAACEKYNIDLVGGDTTSSLTGMTINITAIGESAPENLAYRSGAKVNDLICVSGNLGAAYLGLQILEREKKIFESDPSIQPKLDDYEYILQRQLKPEARADIVEALHKQGIQPTAMIDISDGLSSEVLHICTNSNVGCKIYQEKIPITAESHKVAEELHLEMTTCALNGGEDYELLFTVPLTAFDLVGKLKDVHIIGHIVEKKEGITMVMPDGTTVPVIAKGWNTLK